MNSMIQLSIISIIIFNVVSIHKCFDIDKSEFNIFKCYENKIESLSVLDNHDNKSQPPNSKNANSETQKQKMSIDIKYYELKNNVLKQNNLKSQNENKEKLSVDKIEAPEVLKAIQRGIRGVIKKSKKNSGDIDSKFFENKFGYINLFLRSKKIVFNAFSVENFLNLRKLYNIEEEFNYSFSLDLPFEKQDTGNDKFKLFYTADYKYVIKTITAKEEEVLKYSLFNFFTHFCRFPDSLLPKISGLYHIQHNLVETFVIVMPNIYPHPLQNSINKRYYLKGADKEALVSDDKGDRAFRLLDNNFVDKYPNGFIIPSKLHNSIKQILENDCKFLVKIGVTNYSLALVTSPVEKPTFNGNNNQLGQNKMFQQKVINNQVIVNNIIKNVSVSIGFYNVLHKYDFSRVIEHTVKSTLLRRGDKTTIQDPYKYATRFIDFITKSVFISAGDN